jgi:membrane-associated phospholipid phosphatase
MYGDGGGDARHDADAGLSFFSGHTSTAFAIAASYAYTYGVRRPRSGLRALVWVVSLLAASSMPVLRVASGEHFWSDVIVGAIVGTGVGIAVPALHRKRARRPALRAGIGPGPGGSGLGLWASF